MSEKKRDTQSGSRGEQARENDTDVQRNATDIDADTTASSEASGTVLTEELYSQIEQLQNENEQLKDKFLRKAAEFENYKRRTEQEYASLTRYAQEQLLIDILPVLDDFERSLGIGKERREFGPFYKGVELIYNKFLSLLNSIGVQPIESIGRIFDVDLHDALMQVAREDVPPGTIVEEVERGYTYNDKVLRHAKVVVAKEPEPSDSEAGEADGGEAAEHQRRERK